MKIKPWLFLTISALVITGVLAVSAAGEAREAELREVMFLARLLRERPACVTSPPYWGLRDYGVEGQLGLEKTPEEYVSKMVEVFREVKRVLRDDGTLWLNLGDSYAGNCSRTSTGRAGLGNPREGVFTKNC